MRNSLQACDIGYEYLEGDDWDRQQKFEATYKVKQTFVSMMSTFTVVKAWKVHLDKLIRKAKRNETN